MPEAKVKASQSQSESCIAKAYCIDYFIGKFCNYRSMKTAKHFHHERFAIYGICLNHVRPNKVLKKFLVLLPGQLNENTQTDRQIITKRHNDRKYIRIQTLMPLNMHKNSENIHN